MASASSTLLILNVLILGMASFSKGYKQEIYISLNNGAALYFDEAQPDMSTYQEILSRNTWYIVCSRGLWFGYFDAGYKNIFRPFPSLSGTKGETDCSNYYIGGSLGSLRYVGPNDTSIDAISLYSGPYASGEEIIVTGDSLVNITMSVVSLATTGKSNWTLYQGKNLYGGSICFSAPQNNLSHYFSGGYGPITSIGSVLKGCKK